MSSAAATTTTAAHPPVGGSDITSTSNIISLSNDILSQYDVMVNHHQVSSPFPLQLDSEGALTISICQQKDDQTAQAINNLSTLFHDRVVVDCLNHLERLSVLTIQSGFERQEKLESSQLATRMTTITQALTQQASVDNQRTHVIGKTINLIMEGISNSFEASQSSSTHSFSNSVRDIQVIADMGDAVIVIMLKFTRVLSSSHTSSLLLQTTTTQQMVQLEFCLYHCNLSKAKLSNQTVVAIIVEALEKIQTEKVDEKDSLELLTFCLPIAEQIDSIVSPPSC